MSSESHLKHKKAQLSELKDDLLTRQISAKQYEMQARRLEKEIKALEAQEEPAPK